MFCNAFNNKTKHLKCYMWCDNIQPVRTRTRLQRHSLSLAWRLDRKMRRRLILHETGFIYSLKVFYFLLYRRRYFLLVSELIQYACQRRPEIRLRSQATHVYKHTKIQGPRFQRSYIIARDKKSDSHGTLFQSSPKINRMLITRPFAYSESLQHPTIAVFLIKILIFFSTTQQCSLVPKQSTLSSDRIRGPTPFGKALNLIFPKLSSQNMRGFDLVMILSPSFHGLRN